MNAIMKLASTNDKIAIVAHNPAVTLLTNRLCGSLLDNLPTSGIVDIKLPLERWQGLAHVAGQASLGCMLTPKMLKDRDQQSDA